MSTSAMSSGVTGRPLRWPWAVVGGFIALATYGSVLVVDNGESIANQVPYIIAFAMFGAVGALVVSRAPGNRIGWLLLYGSGVTVVSYVCSELMTLLVRNGTTDGVGVTILALVANAGWILGIIPVLLFIRSCSPTGGCPRVAGSRSPGSRA
ncbi:MAG: VWA domain-containing protein [Actinomycetota bacterium]|nr:VWA domain-containing protein [Actinomycetota bacterium]